MVEPVIIRFEYGQNEDGYHDIPIETSGQMVVVDKVYSKPPIEKLNERYQELVANIDLSEKALRVALEEKSKAFREMEAAKKQATDLSKFIVNRKEILTAERITIFKEGEIQPEDFVKKSDRAIRLSFTMEVYGGKIDAWHYKMWNEDQWSSGDYFDISVGLLINKSDEEIREIALARQSKAFNDYAISRCNDQFLTPANVEKKKAIVERDRSSKIIQAKADLEKAQKRVDELTNNQ